MTLAPSDRLLELELEGLLRQDPAGDIIRPEIDLPYVRPPWQARAACRALPKEVMFPSPGSRWRGATPAEVRAKAVCVTCPVVADCRTYAFSGGPELDGVWGGLTALDRRRMLAGRPPEAPRRPPASDRAGPTVEGVCACCRRPGPVTETAAGLLDGACRRRWDAKRRADRRRVRDVGDRTSFLPGAR